MRKKSATVCLLFAWLCANGVVSDVAQVLAWGRMFAGYARVLSVTAAIAETFDASKPCDLCAVVKKNRDNDTAQSQAAKLTPEKLLLTSSPDGNAEILAPLPHEWPLTVGWRAVARIEPVLVRPPRA